MTFSPLTPGLLISMGIRYDHSFGISMGMFDAHSSLESKQIDILNKVLEYYSRRHEIANSAKPGTETQLLEEMTGTGFYSPEREDWYRETATASGLAEAHRLVESYSE